MKRLMTILGIIAGLLPVSALSAEPTYRWAELAQVQRIAIAPPLIRSPHLSAESNSEEEQARQETLRELVALFGKTLPERLAESNRFRLAPDALTLRHLRALKWKSQHVFLPDQSSRKSDWPRIDRQRASTLAKRLNVDAVLVCILREPASIREGVRLHHETWNLNPLNISLRRIPPHVNSPRVRAALISRNGQVVWSDEQMASRPRTKPTTARTLQVDYRESTEQVAQQLAESLTRIPPPEPPSR